MPSPQCWAVEELQRPARERPRRAPAGEPKSARHPKLAGAAGPPTLSGRPSPGAPTLRDSRSLRAFPEELIPRSPDPGEPATAPFSAAAAKAGAAGAAEQHGPAPAAAPRPDFDEVPLLRAGGAPVRAGGGGARPGDVRPALHPDRGGRHPRGAVPSARQGSQRSALRRHQEGERDPQAGGDALRPGPDQQRSQPAAQRDAGRADPGHLFQGHLRAGTVAHFRPGAHPEGHLRRALHQRRAPSVRQAGESSWSDWGFGEFRLHHGSQHPEAFPGRGALPRRRSAPFLPRCWS